VTDKVDFKREIAAYRARLGVFEIVDVPDLRYLMIDGHGDPNTAAFAEAAEALYPLAYKLKFASKRTLGRDYVVMPLEGLWWSAEMDAFTSARDKSRWDWTLMIMVPDWIDDGLFGDAVGQIAADARPRRLDEVRLGSLSEGRCVQTLHVGSYDDETEVLARMHERAAEAGASRVSKEELLAASDVLTVHLKLSDRTTGLLGAAELAAMKPSAILINTSRGPIVDEKALVTALTIGTIAGAGLDVYETEPLPAGHPLRGAPNTVLLPHLGYVTEAGYRSMYTQVVEDITAWRSGSPIRVLTA
jgi:hypothetical protein